MKTTNLLLNVCALLGFIAVASSAQAQDLIILKHNNDTIKAKVTEVGVDEIKYKMWPVNESDPVMVLEKKKIRKVILQSGTVLNFFLEDMDDPKNYVGQRKNLLKADIVSPAIGVTSLAFEHSIKPGRSYEIGLGIIGLGFNTKTYGYSGPYNPNLMGCFVRTGYKFINTPDFVTRGARYAHLLKGGYIRPELVFVNYSFNEQVYLGTGNYSTASYRTSGAAFFMNFGKQFIFSNRVGVDVFAGLGMGSQHTVQTGGTPSGGMWGYYSDFSFGSFGYLSDGGGSISPALQFGLKLGILLGSTEEKDKKAALPTPGIRSRIR